MAAFKADVPMFSEKVHTRFALKVTEPARNIKVILKDSDKLNSKGNAIFYIIKMSAMRAQEKTTKKYNITISKLFQIVINLNEEQQMALLHHAEGLLVREKRTNIRKACDIPVNFAMDKAVKQPCCARCCRVNRETATVRRPARALRMH